METAISKNSDIEIKFQPIVSIVQKSVIGFSCDIINCNSDSDITSISELYHYENRLLFIKINMDVLSEVVNSEIILDLVSKFNIAPKSVVLEIYENNLDNEQALKLFINLYRSKGFLISLTIGSGFSALNKIFYVEPDIIKIDEPITRGIEIDFYKKEIFKALVNLSKRISALIIADGVNTEEQAIILMELGADMLQGNYFGRYQNSNPRILSTADKRVDNIVSLFKIYKKEQIEFEQLKHRKYEELLNTVISELSTIKEEQFDKKLKELINKYDIFECVYVLNESGVQVSDTITHFDKIISRKSLIFRPAEKGIDHSLKKYYYLLKDMGLDKYSTDEYLSLASGNLCITISEKFESINKTKYILCVDFVPTNVDR